MPTLEAARLQLEHLEHLRVAQYRREAAQPRVAYLLARVVEGHAPQREAAEGGVAGERGTELGQPLGGEVALACLGLGLGLGLGLRLGSGLVLKVRVRDRVTENNGPSPSSSAVCLYACLRSEAKALMPG